MSAEHLNDKSLTPRERHKRLVNDLFGLLVLLESAWDDSVHDDRALCEAYPFTESLDEVRARVQAYADALDEADQRIDCAMGARLRALHRLWTEGDERPGECVNMGSGADVCDQLFPILTDHGFPIE